MPNRSGCRLWLAIAVFSLAFAAGGVRAQLRPGEDVQATLAAIDATKTSEHPAFVATLSRLARVSDALPAASRAYLDYLQAWQLTYAGDHARAVPLLRQMTEHAPSKVLRLRAAATLVNILSVGRRYEEAFVQLNAMMEALGSVDDTGVRLQVLGEAAQMLSTSGQYELAADYAGQAVALAATPSAICRTNTIELNALYRGKRIDGDDTRFVQWVAECEKAGEELSANALRADVAESAIEHGRAAAAISLLERYQGSVVRDAYRLQIAQFEALLARAYWVLGNATAAEQHALTAIRDAVPGEFSQPVVSATETAYLVAKKRGDWRSATHWLERHAQADKGYLDDVSARALAYQVVKQQVAASHLETDALDKQNQILHLQREVDQHNAETSRLSFLLLLSVTATIVLWLIRTKRSQLRFMRMARHDSLTGISNRQHFVDQCEAALVEASKTDEAISLVLFDLDHFKQINDTFGHAEGDWVLLRVVAECRDHLHASDVFGRLGGEEFAVMLRSADINEASERAERMRKAIGEPSHEHQTIARVTASFGAACTTPFGYDLDRLLMKADEAMYRAKAAGRDRVVTA